MGITLVNGSRKSKGKLERWSHTQHIVAKIPGGIQSMKKEAKNGGDEGRLI